MININSNNIKITSCCVCVFDEVIQSKCEKLLRYGVYEGTSPISDLIKNPWEFH